MNLDILSVSIQTFFDPWYVAFPPQKHLVLLGFGFVFLLIKQNSVGIQGHNLSCSRLNTLNSGCKNRTDSGSHRKLCN